MQEFKLLQEEELNELTKLGFNRTPKFTDYAILTGCQGFKSYDHESKWLLSSDIQTQNAIVDKDGLILELGDTHIYPAAVDNKGKITFAEENQPFYGIRPVTELSDKITNNSKIIEENDEIIKIEYGELPKNVVSEKQKQELDNVYKDYVFPENVKRYRPIITYYNPENPVNHKIDRIKYPYKKYKLNDKKFILMVTDRTFMSIDSILSDKSVVTAGQNYWLEIEPINWTYYKKLNLMIADDVLFTGEINRNKIKDYMYYYEDNDIYKYLNETFSKDIISSDNNINQKKPLVICKAPIMQKHMIR